MSTQPSEPPPTEPSQPTGTPQPLLPDKALDDGDEGWGESSEGRDDAFYERERPPHHGD